MFQLEETTEITQLLVLIWRQFKTWPGHCVVFILTVPLSTQGYRGKPDRILGGGEGAGNLQSSDILSYPPSYPIHHPILRGPCNLSLFRFPSLHATETGISSGCKSFLGKEQLSFKPIWTQTDTTFLSRKYIRKDKKVRACCSDIHDEKADKPILMHLTFCFHIMHLQKWLLNKITIKSNFRSSKVNLQTEKIWNLLTIKVNIAGKEQYGQILKQKWKKSKPGFQEFQWQRQNLIKCCKKRVALKNITTEVREIKTWSLSDI